jgi:hypothetical protein
MREMYTALVKLLTPPSEFGDTKCFTNVVAWAEDPDDYTATISRKLEIEGIFVLEVEQCHRVSDYEEIPEDMLRFIEWAKTHPENCIIGDREYYPSRPA